VGRAGPRCKPLPLLRRMRCRRPMQQLVSLERYHRRESPLLEQRRVRLNTGLRVGRQKSPRSRHPTPLGIPPRVTCRGVLRLQVPKLRTVRIAVPLGQAWLQTRRETKRRWGQVCQRSEGVRGVLPFVSRILRQKQLPGLVFQSRVFGLPKRKDWDKLLGR